MEKKLTAVFCKNINLTIQTIEGKITVDDLIGFLKMQFENPDYQSSSDIITDVRRAQFEITWREMEALVAFIRSNSKVQVSKKIAVITRAPNQMATSTLFALSMEDNNCPQIIEVFSTLKSTLDWIKNDLPEIEYEHIVAYPNHFSYPSFVV